MSVSDLERQGWEDYEKGKKSTDNPYSKESQLYEHMNWNSGWWDALNFFTTEREDYLYHGDY